MNKQVIQVIFHYYGANKKYQHFSLKEKKTLKILDYEVFYE